ncbi:MAG: hypothetical protein AAB588_04610 [Patescibacteria group bacterium]
MKANVTKRRSSVRNVGILLIAAFGILSLWGANLSMMEHPDGMMSQCPFQTEKVCTMTARAHISYWQDLFLSVPEKMGANIALGMAFLLSASLAIIFFFGFNRLEFAFRPSGGSRAGPPSSLYYHHLYRNIGSGIIHKRE